MRWLSSLKALYCSTALDRCKVRSAVWEFVSAVADQKLPSFVADIMIGCTYPSLRLVLNQ